MITKFIKYFTIMVVRKIVIIIKSQITLNPSSFRMDDMRRESGWLFFSKKGGD